MHYDARPRYDACVLVEEGVDNSTPRRVPNNNKLDLGAISRLRTVPRGIHKGTPAISLTSSPPMASPPIGTQPPRADLMADILQANEAPSSDLANIQPSNDVFDVDKDRAPIKILSKMQRTRNAGNSIFGTKPGSPVSSFS